MAVASGQPFRDLLEVWTARDVLELRLLLEGRDRRLSEGSGQ